MSITLLLQNISTAFSVGLGCGSCCGASVSVFLTSYIVSHAKNMKKSIIAFASFFLGKLIAVSLVCIIAALVGNKFISEEGYIGDINIRFLMQVGVILIGLVLIILWFKEYFTKKSCKTCGGKCSSDDNKQEEKIKNWPPLLLGFIYGITPCTPLLLMAGYSVSMPVFGAAIIAAAFSIASTLSPVLFLILIAGVLSKKMYEEIPKYINYIKLSCYFLFIAMAFIML